MAATPPGRENDSATKETITYPSADALTTFIMAPHSTREAMVYFNFKNLNIASQQVYAAFKKKGIPRPAFYHSKVCIVCGEVFLAINYNQVCCPKKSCRTTNRLNWYKERYLKGKISIQDQKVKWNFIATLMLLRIRSITSKVPDNVWNYRIDYIQRVINRTRGISPRNRRDPPAKGWRASLIPIQTSIYLRVSYALRSGWELSASNIFSRLQAITKSRRLR